MKIFLITLALTLGHFSLQAQGLSFEKNQEGAWIMEDGEKVLFYQAATKSHNGTYSRANYVHPFHGVDGAVLTEDFPPDHLHHRGIFWTWHQVLIDSTRIGDAWECRNFIWDVKDVKRAIGPANSITLSSKVFWKSPLWKDEDGAALPFLREDVVITVFRRQNNYRIVDFEISLTALESNLKIGGSEDHKGYGGFSVRMKMPKDIQFVSTEGVVKPEIGQIEAGPWMDISASLAKDGDKAGIIIINHPDNPMYPEKWILRKSGSMQNPVYPGREPVAVSMSQPTILKYRLVVYKGDLGKQTIETLQFK
jgi:hypothetical protein